jgi:hypothetical protein
MTVSTYKTYTVSQPIKPHPEHNRHPLWGTLTNTIWFGGEERYIQDSSRNLRERDHLENPDVNARKYRNNSYRNRMGWLGCD